MLFQGKIHSKKKAERYHTVEVADLDIATQGKNSKECLVMIKDAIQTLFLDEKVDVEVIPSGQTRFFIRSNNLKPLIARFLRVQRENRGLSLQEVADRLGYSSRSSYAQYEQGKSLPSLDKLSAFLDAVNPDKDIVLTTATMPREKAS